MISNNSYVKSSGVSEKFSIILNTLKKVVNFKNLIFIILSFAMANTSFMGEYSPFSLVLFGAASVFNVPLILVLLSSVAGLALQTLSVGILIKLLAFFMIFTLITVIINIEGVSKKFSVFIKFIISLSIVEIGYNLISGTFVTEFFSMLSNIAVAAILYFVFVAGIYVLSNITKEYIFSREESIAMVTVLALALTVFKDVMILQFSVFNILILILVLVFGWKNGWVSGATAGLVIGLILTLITTVNMTYVVTLAFSGFIGGILNKVGKIGVVIGFIAGNLYIAYYSNGFSELTMRVSELVIASVSLLFMPKIFEMKLDRIFNKNKALDNPYENMLDSATNVKNKLGAVSDVFDSIANIVVDVSKEDAKETREVIKKYIENYIEENCLGCNNRKDCLKAEKLDIIVDYVATKLEHNEKIFPNMLDLQCESSEKLVENIYEVYNSMKLMRILKEKEKENSVKLSNQYKEVSKILANISKKLKNDIAKVNKEQLKLREELKFYGYIVYEDDYKKEEETIEYTFVTNILDNIDKQKKEIVDIASNILEKPMTIKLILNSSKKEKSRIRLVSTTEFSVQTSVLNISKSGEEISGDSYLIEELEDLKNLSVISDGKGNGREAARASKTVIDMLEKLLDGGFNEKSAIDIINAVLKLKTGDENFSTLDSMIIDLKTGNAEYIKLGSAPTYIIHENKIITITTSTVPVGISADTDYIPVARKLSENDIIVQISDGIVSDNLNSSDNFFTDYLKEIDITKSTKALLEDLHRFVLKENKNVLKDDVTIIVTKLKRNKK